MPKNHKPKGGRPARNFEPRYAKKTPFHDRHNDGRPPRADAGDDRSSSRPAGPGHKSPKHRGYRPDAASGAPKRRWTEQERAGRDEARSIRGRAESGRREAPHHRDERGGSTERPRFTGGERRFDGERPRYNRDGGAERPRFNNDRGGERPRYNREGGSERPRYNDDRPRRDFNSDRGAERPRYNREGGSERPRYNDDRPRRDFNSDRGAERPRYNNDRGAERPRYNREGGAERPRRDGDRPSYNSDRGAERPRYNNDRGAERPRYNDDRPRRDGDRPSYNSDRGADRPRYNREGGAERPRRDGDRPSYNSDRGAERPRYNGDRQERPRYNDERPRRTEDRPRRDDRRAEPRPSRDNWNKTAAAPVEPAQDVVHERLEAKTVQAAEVENVTFGDLGLGSNIVETLVNMGAVSPFPIQAASIPAVLEGRDVLGRGRTGSGKTIAFGAPLVESILKSQAGKKREFGRSPRAIILAPTRELALQIDRTIQPIARSVGLFTTQIYGGVPQGRQVGALKKGVDIVIGTPGRVEDLINQGKLDLSDCRIAVLDEADHMCELGFVEPVQRILRHTAEGSQKLLFSATLDREVAALVEEFLVDPAVYEVAGETQDSGTIEHRVLVIDHRDKAEILASLVDREGQTLVFARTRAYAEMLAEQFEEVGIAAVSLHGDLNQAKRTRNLARLTSGKVQVLVATDVAARGIHVDDIDLVVQADAPDEYKTYMHRSGRTGRAGRSGRVVTLITRQRQRRMTELLERAEIDAPFEPARVGDEVIEEIAGRVPTAADLTA
ncbi:DEAD/DEAH box helicase [Microbacterium sp. NPDC056234]|uniref:DEAD/DEAH box helicase n=1 Tax=Microbacterium sp. NPDC056234 TaxID=3345757 RepID=UPI0035DBE52B